MTAQIFGFSEHRSHARCEYLTLAFSPLSAPLRSRWRNNGLSADFLGDYVTTFLPANGSEAADVNRQAEIRHAVTYIANELLENAMKYHEHNVNIPIRIHLELTSDHIVVSASNGVGGGQALCYKTFVERIQDKDAGELLVKQLEESSGSDPSSTISCLGLLTMMNDYGAELGWMFEVNPDFTEFMTVTTSAVLPLRNLPGVPA
jgi:hypothetical protein